MNARINPLTSQITEVHYSHSYDPQFEADRQKCLMPHARHQEMLERHKQDKASRRENHNKGVHRMPRVLSLLI